MNKIRRNKLNWKIFKKRFKQKYLTERYLFFLQKRVLICIKNKRGGCNMTVQPSKVYKNSKVLAQHPDSNLYIE